MYGYWIAADENTVGAKLYYFSKTVNLPKGVRFTAKISANTRYTLYVNGKFVCNGPCKASQFERCYEEPDLSPYLCEGENEIKAEVLYLPYNMMISAYKGADACLWFLGEISDGKTTTEFISDASWKCVRDDSHLFHNPQAAMNSVPPFEERLSEEKLVSVPVRQKNQPSLDRGSFSVCGVSDEYVLSPRQIPILVPNDLKALSIVKHGKGFIELDSSVYTTSMIDFTFKGTAGGTAKIIYSECYTKEDGSKGKRDDSTGVIRGNFDIVHLSGNEQSFTTFWFRAFRFIRIEYDCEDFELDMTKSGHRPFFYPLVKKGTFECNRQDFNDMWTVSENTVLCSTHELFVDCPYYEQQQYDMDSCLESLYTYRMSDDYRMQRKVISNLAASQLPDGMLQANYPSTSIQVIPSFSLFWILMLREYLRYTGDIQFVKSMSGTALKILEGFDNLINANGVIKATKYWHYADWVPCWFAGIPTGGMTEPTALLDMIYTASLGAATEIFCSIGKDSYAEDFKLRAEKHRKAIIKNYWDSEEQLFRDSASNKAFSEHTALWAVLSDTFTGKQAEELIDRVMAKNVERCTFSMNYFVLRALEKINRYHYANNIIKGWNTMLDNNCTTWCENPGACRSECHGWSSVPIYEFSEVILGVFPETDGYSITRIQPGFDIYDNVTWAKGTVPTQMGTISVAWNKNGGKITVDVEKPEGISLKIVLPSGEEILTNENSIHIER